MTLVRWKPINDIWSLQHEINRAFDERLRDRQNPATGAWCPAVDLIENADGYRLVAELPGLNREQVKITFSDHVLTLRGEKRTEEPHNGDKDEWHVVERSYGMFERSFHLNAPVQAEQVKASFENGVLTVMLPKAEESKAREIQIQG